MRTTTFFVFIIASVLFFFVLPACGEPPPMEMSPTQKAMVDTLFTREVRVLRPKLDSLCQQGFDDRVQYAVDSILQVRLEEKAALLNRKL